MYVSLGLAYNFTGRLVWCLEINDVKLYIASDRVRRAYNITLNLLEDIGKFTRIALIFTFKVCG